MCSERLRLSVFVRVCVHPPSLSKFSLAPRSSSPDSPDSTRTSRRTASSSTASRDRPPGSLCPSSLPGGEAAGLAGSTSTVGKNDQLTCSSTWPFLVCLECEEGGCLPAAVAAGPACTGPGAAAGRSSPGLAAGRTCCSLKCGWWCG